MHMVVDVEPKKMSGMTGEKKCPECGKWSGWQQKLDDKCEHCGALLSPGDKKRQENIAQQQKENQENWIFYIQDDDPGWKKTLKKTGNFIHYVLMAIIGFFAWLIAAIPG